MSAAYFSAVIFCDIVTKYAAKKTKQYFTNDKPHKSTHNKQIKVVTAPKYEAISSDSQLNLEDID